MAKLSTEQFQHVLKEKYAIQNERKINNKLSKICKECGRYRKIPISFCNECWREMDATINK